MDDIFHTYAAEKGLSDSSFWILYTLIQSEKPYTQNELCAEWFYSKQTVHSAVAALTKSGYIELEHVPGSRNSKYIVLTQEGRAYADIHILPLIHAEQRTFAGLSSEERDTYYCLVKKHLDLFDREVQALKSHRKVD